MPFLPIDFVMRVSCKSHLKLFSVTTGGIKCGVIFSLVPAMVTNYGYHAPVVVYQTAYVILIPSVFLLLKPFGYEILGYIKVVHYSKNIFFVDFSFFAE